MLKTVIPSEAGQFFACATLLRSVGPRSRGISLLWALCVKSFFLFLQLSTSCLVLNCPSSPLSLAPPLPPQVVRSSGRIPKEIPILLIGSDLGGKVFSEHTSTVLLSLHGAGVLSRHKLSPEQELVLRWPERNKETEIRVVGQVGSQNGHHTYGVAFFDQDLNFWDIDFPPVTAAQRELGLLSLVCSHCKTLEKVDDSGHLWFRLWCCRPYRHFWRWCS